MKELRKKAKYYDVVNEMIDTRKIAVYVRESTEKQAKEGYNIHEQEERCLAYIKALNGLDKYSSEIKVYREKGYSAKTIERPVLNQLLEDVESGKVKTVIVQKIDRLVRRNMGFYEVADLLESHNTRLIALRESIDTNTSAWKIVASMHVTLAEIEQDTISERTNESLLCGARNGSYIKGSTAPFGTVRQKIYKDNGMHIITLRQDAMLWEVLKMIYDLAYHGVNCTQISLQICNHPNMVAINKKLGEDQIENILSNRIYCGLMPMKDRKSKQITEYPIEFENCFTIEYWNQVQNNRRVHLHRETKNEYAYHGKVFCECGTLCIVDITNKKLADGSIKKYRYYVCPHCGKRISEQVIHERVESKISQHFELEVNTKYRDNQIYKLNRIESLKKDAYQMYLDGEIDSKIYFEHLKKCDDDFTRVSKRIKTRKKKFDNLSCNERKEYLELAIESINVNMSKKTATIHYFS